MHCLLGCLFRDGVLQYMHIMTDVRMTKEMERICRRLCPNLRCYSNIYLKRFRKRTNNTGYRVTRLGFDRGTSRIQAIVITA
jgi:hypothetical protein